MFGDPFANQVAEFLIAHRFAAETYDREFRRQEAIEEQIVNSRDEAPSREIARATKNNQCAAVDGRNRFTE